MPNLIIKKIDEMANQLDYENGPADLCEWLPTKFFDAAKITNHYGVNAYINPDSGMTAYEWRVREATEDSLGLAIAASTFPGSVDFCLEVFLC